MELSKKAMKALKNFTADDLYVRLRPLTSTYLRPSEPHEVHWSVEVELRATPPQSWIDSGSSLSEILEDLGSKIPRRADVQPGYMPATKRGKNNLQQLAPVAPLGSKDAKIVMKKKGKKS